MVHFTLKMREYASSSQSKTPPCPKKFSSWKTIWGGGMRWPRRSLVLLAQAAHRYSIAGANFGCTSGSLCLLPLQLTWAALIHHQVSGSASKGCCWEPELLLLLLITHRGGWQRSTPLLPVLCSLPSIRQACSRKVTYTTFLDWKHFHSRVT